MKLLLSDLLKYLAQKNFTAHHNYKNAVAVSSYNFKKIYFPKHLTCSTTVAHMKSYCIPQRCRHFLCTYSLYLIKVLFIYFFPFCTLS